MATPPPSTGNSLAQRLSARARRPALAKVCLRRRFAHVDARLLDGDLQPLCRLRYAGSASTRGVGIYRARHDDYQPMEFDSRRAWQTVHLPDGPVPLHPPVLSGDVASLLPDGPRGAVLWTIDLDETDEPDEPVTVAVRRAAVRSRTRLDYVGVQADHAADPSTGRAEFSAVS